ncbi:MAG: hypothetical protein LBC43_01860 [Bifidobacteriaceae bacterium]|nr:hypothetical protein [Bifidobacteriaceae bacterium]
MSEVPQINQSFTSLDPKYESITVDAWDNGNLELSESSYSEITLVVIPTFPNQDLRMNYEVSYYLNDLSQEQVQVLMEVHRKYDILINLYQLFRYGNQTTKHVLRECLSSNSIEFC